MWKKRDLKKGPDGRFMEIDPQKRFFSKVICKPNGCWDWTDYIGKDGYGRFEVDGRPILAFRFSYETLVGKIPEGLSLDHLCRNR